MEASGLETKLPIQGFVEYGYGAVLDQAALPGRCVALAQATKGNENAVQTLADTLINELSSLGTYYESRRRTALAAMIELGQTERAVSTMADEERPNWTHCLMGSLDRDMVSIV